MKNSMRRMTYSAGASLGGWGLGESAFFDDSVEKCGRGSWGSRGAGRLYTPIAQDQTTQY